MTTVRVPASTANLGPGFDALGLALSLDRRHRSSLDGDAARRCRTIDERHPAVIAFRRGGGTGALWLRSPIPTGRGLGFSGAMRIGGLALAADRAGGRAVRPRRRRPGPPRARHRARGPRRQRRRLAARWARGDGRGPRRARARSASTPAVVVWIPPQETSTQRSRHGLPSSVSFADAAFNVGRTALLVAALASATSTRCAGRPPIACTRTAASPRQRPRGTPSPPAWRPAPGAAGCRAAVRPSPSSPTRRLPRPSPRRCPSTVTRRSSRSPRRGAEVVPDDA